MLPGELNETVRVLRCVLRCEGHQSFFYRKETANLFAKIKRNHLQLLISKQFNTFESGLLRVRQPRQGIGCRWPTGFCGLSPIFSFRCQFLSTVHSQRSDSQASLRLGHIFFTSTCSGDSLRRLETSIPVSAATRVYYRLPFRHQLWTIISLSLYLAFVKINLLTPPPVRPRRPDSCKSRESARKSSRGHCPRGEGPPLGRLISALWRRTPSTGSGPVPLCFWVRSTLAGQPKFEATGIHNSSWMTWMDDRSDVLTGLLALTNTRMSVFTHTLEAFEYRCSYV